MKKIGNTIAEYIWRHASAIFLMVNVWCIALCNPFVVDKFQGIYRYPVTVTGSIIWDVIWFVGCIGCGFLEHIIRKFDET